MKKRFLSILLTLCMVLSLVPMTVSAEANDGVKIISEENNGDTPVCICETACAAESMNADCPVCGAEGAVAESCGKYGVEESQEEQKVEQKEEQKAEKPQEEKPQEEKKEEQKRRRRCRGEEIRECSDFAGSGGRGGAQTGGICGAYALYLRWRYSGGRSHKPQQCNIYSLERDR